MEYLISDADRLILREVAKKQLEMAFGAIQEQRKQTTMRRFLGLTYQWEYIVLKKQNQVLDIY